MKNKWIKEGIITEIEKIESTNKYLLKVCIKGQTLKNANILDNVQIFVKNKYKDAVILSSDSSRYYNQRLYPLVNDMERKLRNLLYLANVLVGKEYEGVICNLETLDFGDIYKLLFIDTNFMSYIRNILKKGEKGLFNNNEFTKNDLIRVINNIDESVLWDKILYNNAVPTLRNNFQKVRNYRNDIMHAHNIDQKSYEDANKLYKSINQELDNEINKIKTSPVTEVNKDIGKMLSSTLASIDLSNYIKLSNDLSEIMSKFTYNTKLNEVAGILSKASEVSGLKEISEKIQSLSLVNSSYLDTIKNLTESIKYPKLDIYNNFSSPMSDNMEDSSENDSSNGDEESE